MAIIPKSFIDAVVALGIEDDNGQKHWIGTGFIVGRKETSAPTLSTFYIVTNRHVLEGIRCVFVRFNSLGDSYVKDYPISLYDMDNRPAFSAHPNSRTDVAAIQILPQTLINDESIWGAIDLDDHALTLTQMEATGLEEGCLVYALGFPMNQVDIIKAPICRLGCISRIKDTYIRKAEYPTFLVDAQVFPGNSGGPIISRPEILSIAGTPANDKANLIGILSNYIIYTDTLYSKQTGQPRMIREENSGLTVVHPVDRIKEVVNMEWQRIENLRVAQIVKELPAVEESSLEGTAV